MLWLGGTLAYVHMLAVVWHTCLCLYASCFQLAEMSSSKESNATIPYHMEEDGVPHRPETPPAPPAPAPE